MSLLNSGRCIRLLITDVTAFITLEAQNRAKVCCTLRLYMVMYYRCYSIKDHSAVDTCARLYKRVNRLIQPHQAHPSVFFFFTKTEVGCCFVIVSIRDNVFCYWSYSLSSFFLSISGFKLRNKESVWTVYSASLSLCTLKPLLAQVHGSGLSPGSPTQGYLTTVSSKSIV